MVYDRDRLNNNLVLKAIFFSFLELLGVAAGHLVLILALLVL